MRPCKFNRYHMCNTPCGSEVTAPPHWCKGWKNMDVTKKQYEERGYKKIYDKMKIGKGKDLTGAK